MLGNKNRIVLQLGQQGQVTTSGGTILIIPGNHVRIPCKCLIEKIDITGTVEAGGSSIIKIHAGVDASVTVAASGTISPTVLRVNATIVAAQKDKIYDADQEFCLSETSTTGKTLDHLNVSITFREYEA